MSEPPPVEKGLTGEANDSLPEMDRLLNTLPKAVKQFVDAYSASAEWVDPCLGGPGHGWFSTPNCTPVFWFLASKTGCKAAIWAYLLFRTPPNNI